VANINIYTFLSYLLVGGSSTLLQYAIMALLVVYGNVQVLVASAIGFGLSAICNYWLNAHITFGGKQNHRRSFPRFAVVALAGLVINQIVLMGMLYIVLPLSFAQVIATICVLCWNFFVNAKWSFKRREL
jgi:putative flippase GtrA